MVALTNSTQSFYVTLDLSSSSNNLRPRRKVDLPQSVPNSATSVANVSMGNAEAPAGRSNSVVTAASEVHSEQIRSSVESEEQIQILDFHKPNPIVSYQNQIYSCEWTSAIGTDILLATPDPDSTHPALREGLGVSVLAATSLKLSGRPIELESRHPTNSENRVQGPEPATATSNDRIATPEPSQTATIEIPSDLAPNRNRQAQANFLQRLIAVKSAKGEEDEVTIHATRTNQGSGWRSQQHATAENQAGEAGEGDETEEGIRRSSRARRGRLGRPRRGTWRAKGPRTVKGGLFRDYRPQLWDTEGADIRNNSSRTPESWGLVEGAETGRQASSMDVAAGSSATSRMDQQQFLEDNTAATPSDTLNALSSVALRGEAYGSSGSNTEMDPPIPGHPLQTEENVQEELRPATQEGNTSGNVERADDVEMDDA